MSHFKARLALFSIQPFRWYILSCAAAMFGNGLTYIAMTWVLLKGQHHVGSVAVLMACFWSPNILLGPLSGVVVDKLNRKALLLFCNLSRMVLLLLFWLLLTNSPPAWAIYGLAMTTGTILSLYMPAAMTLVREIVPKKTLLYANATVDMAYELGAVCGMGSSGLIIAFSSVKTTFFINAMSYLLSALALLMISYKRKTDADKLREPVLTEMKLGFQYLMKDSRLLLLYGIQMLFFVCYMTAPILLAPYAKDILHASSGQFGYIEASMSVGAVSGGLLSPYFAERFGYMRVTLLETLLCGVAFYCFSHNLNLFYSVLWYFLIGFSFSIWALLITTAQGMTALHFQGRVHSLFNSVSGILILCFYLLLGSIGERITLAHLYWVEVILMGLSFILLLLYRQHQGEDSSTEPLEEITVK
jgi:MFS family permease